MDNRKSNGERKRPKMLPRQVRLYAVTQDPKTGRQAACPGVAGRVGGGVGVLTDALIQSTSVRPVR